MKRKKPAIDELLGIMARLRGPKGCPWDREQTHRSLRWHAVEEVYELLDAIESGDDHELEEELGDLLLQVAFHCQLARERRAFDFNSVAERISQKLVRRHPHVFGDVRVKNIDQLWANWEKIKRSEKHGTRHARPSAFDGIPRHLPALMRAEKLLKKAQRAGLLKQETKSVRLTRREIAKQLFDLAAEAHARKLSPEDLLRAETRRREKAWRKIEEAPEVAPVKGS